MMNEGKMSPMWDNVKDIAKGLFSGLLAIIIGVICCALIVGGTVLVIAFVAALFCAPVAGVLYAFWLFGML